MNGSKNLDTTSTEAIRRGLKEFLNTYRTVLMNKKYYGHRLDSVSRQNLLLEVLVAIGTSSAIGAWAIWKDSPGNSLWAVLAGTATLIAVVKPTLQLPGRIQVYSKLFAGLGDLWFDLTEIFREINRRENFDRELSQNFHRSLRRLRELQRYDEPRPRKKLLRFYYEEVRREVPADSLWMPIDVSREQESEDNQEEGTGHD